MNTEKYSISFLDELDNIELANTFVEKLPKKDQKRLEYIFNHEEEYSDSDYWDELRNLVYKHFGTTDTLMFARGIEWDIDEEDIDEVSLPEDADVWVPEGKDIADVLTDMYGFCIKSIESVDELQTIKKQKNMEQTNLDSTALGLTNPYEYLPPLQTLYRSHNSTKKATSLSTKEKAKKRRAKRKAQRHNR